MIDTQRALGVIHSGAPTHISITPDKLADLACEAIRTGIHSGRRSCLQLIDEVAAEFQGAAAVAAFCERLKARIEAELPADRIAAERERLRQRAESRR